MHSSSAYLTEYTMAGKEIVVGVLVVALAVMAFMAANFYTLTEGGKLEAHESTQGW